MSEKLTRDQRQQQTRAKLLQAGEAVLIREGYQGATVPKIAQEAGFTTGAVYSNFSGKEELFVAIFEERAGAQASRRREVAAMNTVTLEERVRLATQAWVDFIREEPQLLVLFIEFWSYSRRDPELRSRFAEVLAESRLDMIRLIDEALESRRDDAASAEDVGTAVYALAHGMILHHLADPEGVSPERLGEAFTWLFRGAGWRAPGGA